MDLRRLEMSFDRFYDEGNFRYLLQNAKLLEKLHLKVVNGQNLVGLLSPSARSLKALHLSVFLTDGSVIRGGICEELKALAGDNMLEALSFKVRVIFADTVGFVGSIIQKVENVLIKPGWCTLSQVSFKLLVLTYDSLELCEALQSLPDRYLNHLTKLDSVTFNYSAS